MSGGMGGVVWAINGGGRLGKRAREMSSQCLPRLCVRPSSTTAEQFDFAQPQAGKHERTGLDASRSTFREQLVSTPVLLGT
jgi:hypothetical protein